MNVCICVCVCILSRKLTLPFFCFTKERMIYLKEENTFLKQKINDCEIAINDVFLEVATIDKKIKAATFRQVKTVQDFNIHKSNTQQQAGQT